VSTSSIFAYPDAWSGGYYELAMELGSRSDERLKSALETLWAYGGLDGCYLDSTLEPWQQRRVQPVNDCDLETRLHGALTASWSDLKIACCSIVCRLVDGADWLYFALPIGSLERVFHWDEFAIWDYAGSAWRPRVDDWLRALGRHVYTAAPFQLALVGRTDTVEEDEDAEGVAAHGVPSSRGLGYLVPSGDDLQWYPPTW